MDKGEEKYEEWTLNIENDLSIEIPISYLSSPSPFVLYVISCRDYSNIGGCLSTIDFVSGHPKWSVPISGIYFNLQIDLSVIK